MQQFSPTACMYNEKRYIENQRTDAKSSQQYLEMFFICQSVHLNIFLKTQTAVKRKLRTP